MAGVRYKQARFSDVPGCGSLGYSITVAIPHPQYRLFGNIAPRQGLDQPKQTQSASNCRGDQDRSLSSSFSFSSKSVPDAEVSADGVAEVGPVSSFTTSPTMTVSASSA